MSILDGGKSLMIRLAVSRQCRRVTDRPTDRHLATARATRTHRAIKNCVSFVDKSFIAFYYAYVTITVKLTSVSETIRKPPLVKA